METIIINKENPMFAKISWVLRARSTDTIKPVFCCINIDKDYIVCTDSKRLHAIPNFEPCDEAQIFPDGLYTVISSKTDIVLTRTENYQFPNYKNVIPDINNAQFATLIQASKITGVSQAAFTIARAKEDCYINLDFLTDCIDEKKKPATWEFFCFEGFSPMLFYDLKTEHSLKPENINRLAVIMSITAPKIENYIEKYKELQTA